MFNEALFQKIYESAKLSRKEDDLEAELILWHYKKVDFDLDCDIKILQSAEKICRRLKFNKELQLLRKAIKEKSQQKAGLKLF